MELTKESVALLAACGVLIGTVLSNAITFLIHRSKQKDEWIKENARKKIQKGEELYQNFVKWKMAVFSAHVYWVNCVRDDISGKTFMEGSIQRAKENPEQSNIAEITAILAGIYFSELNEKVDLAKKKLESANQVYFMLSNGSRFTDKQKAVEQILDAGQAFDTVIDDLLKELSEIISDMMKK